MDLNRYISPSELYDWAAASEDAVRSSNSANSREFLSASSCRCTTICVVGYGVPRFRLSWRRSFAKFLRSVKNWGQDGFILLDESWGEGPRREELELRRGGGDAELAGSSSSNAKMKTLISSRAEVLTAVVTSPTCNALIFLGVKLSAKELGILSDALRSSPTLKHLLLYDSIRVHIKERGAVYPRILDAVMSNNKLQTLTLERCPVLLFDKTPERLYEFVRKTTSLAHLVLVLSDASDDADLFERSVMKIVDALTASPKTSSIIHLSISKWERVRPSIPEKPAIKLIESNLNTLSVLSLEGFRITSRAFMDIMKSVGRNHSLNSLSLGGSEFPFYGSEDERRQAVGAILDALSKSGLPQLDLRNTLFEHNPDIEAQLARNAAFYAQALKAQAKIPATAVRLFLCGDPRAGKTTLLETLMIANRSPGARVACPPSVNGAKACFGDGCWPPRAKRKRTRGIEVHSLVQKEIQVSVWDMAGEVEYHAFHDHIFPNLSVESSPAFFLFVWSPVSETPPESTKSEKSFETSLLYWLKFITSKTRKSNFQTRVLIVLTRDDKVKAVRAYVEPCVDRLMSDFDKSIKLVGIYAVDAREPTSVGEVASQIFTTARAVLRNVKIYKICNQVRTYLASRKRSKDAKAPVITYSDFESQICKEKFKIDNPAIAKAIAGSLNEFGDIIFLDGLDFLVYDPHWFCHDIMGDLIHSFFGKGSDRTMPIVDGFVNGQYIQEILEIQERKRGRTIEGAQLVNLMVSLHLCCRVDDGHNRRLFIPTALSGPSNPQRALSWRAATIKDPTFSFVGRRLECERKNTTFLTPGFFPLIQVSFHDAYHATGAHVVLGKDLIEIHHDAGDCSVDIIIEFCKVLGNHAIDVMVRSPQEVGGVGFRTIASVVNAITKICADPAGNQGVELEIGIIRPACLHDPAPSLSRENQCVPMKDLKKKLERKLRSADSVLQFRHIWRRNDNFSSEGNSVKELLGVEEFSKVVEEFHDVLTEAAEQFGICVEKGEASTKPVGATHLPRVESRLVREAVGRATGGNSEHMTVASLCRDMVTMTVEVLSVCNDVRSKVDDLNKKIDDMAANIAELRNKILPELERMLLPLVGEKRLPRLCFLTKEGLGIGRRIFTAVFKDIESARLQLACEDRREPHTIDQQEGISVTALGEGVIKKGLPCLRRILELLSLASKVGAVVPVHPGISINFSPLIDCVLHSIDSLDTRRLPIEDGRVKEGSADFEGWEQWLIDVLKQNGGLNASNIETKFKLRRARYKDNPAQVAWLCDKHYALEEPFPLLQLCAVG